MTTKDSVRFQLGGAYRSEGSTQTLAATLIALLATLLAGCATTRYASAPRDAADATICKQCEGTGRVQPCAHCNGSGTTVQQGMGFQSYRIGNEATAMPFMQYNNVPCEACSGRGVLPNAGGRLLCNRCNGTGRLYLVDSSGHRLPPEMVSINYPNGMTYTGETVDGARHGTGTMTWANGMRYTGAWANDKRNGHGTFLWPNGIKFVGAWKNDKIDGQGTQIFPKPKYNGETYSGTFVNGIQEGPGTQAYPNGEKFVGNFVNGQRNGPFQHTLANGEVRSENWTNDVLQGARKDGM